MTTETIPAAAFTFNAGEVALELDGDPLSTRVSLLARSSGPIEHWYWGRVVHDLSGFELSKDKIPIDYAHNSDEVIGFLDQFTVEEQGLRTDGQLVVFSDDDRAAEVAYKSAQGVPYEASINFGGDGIKLEQVDDGASTEVNGFEFEGPGVVVRSWPLRGVAVVPYGADQNTESTIFEKGDGEIVVEYLSGKGLTMAAKKRRAKAASDKLDAAVAEEAVEDQVEEKIADQLDEPADDQESADAEAVDEIIAETEPESADEKGDEPEAQLKPKFDQAEGKRFVAEFGEIGAVWFVEGITFEQAQERQLSQLKSRLDDLLAENEKLKSQVSAVEFGEGDPLEFSASAIGEDDNSAIRSDFERVIPRAAAAFATRFEVDRNGNGKA